MPRYLAGGPISVLPEKFLKCLSEKPISLPNVLSLAFRFRYTWKFGYLPFLSLHTATCHSVFGDTSSDPSGYPKAGNDTNISSGLYS
jgi:hypothetical protein